MFLLLPSPIFASTPFAHTGAALPLTSWRQVGIGLIKRMTALAVCLPRLLGQEAFTTQDVYAPGNGLKVRWIDTASVSAKVVKIKSCWNWAYQQLIRYPVRMSIHVYRNVEAPISISGIARPIPAALGLVYERPEPLFKRARTKSGVAFATTEPPATLLDPRWPRAELGTALLADTPHRTRMPFGRLPLHLTLLSWGATPEGVSAPLRPFHVLYFTRNGGQKCR